MEPTNIDQDSADETNPPIGELPASGEWSRDEHDL
jgi:hypothetical protein